MKHKLRADLGPGKNDMTTMRVLNRIVGWTENGIIYEAGQRHFGENYVQELEDKFGPHEIQRRSKWRLDPISDGCQRWIGVGVYMDAYTKSPSWRHVYARDVQTESRENNENSNRRAGANVLERM